MKAFSISIPKPCHEDWNKMTPDEKGAFCSSCQKSVYDFSTKTDDEIVAVFEKEEKGKVCGRFSPAQLSRPVISFGSQTTTQQLAKFAYALLLVFGAFLFNGSAFGQEMTKGEVKMMGKPSVERYTVDREVEKPKEPITRGQRTNVTCGLRAVKDVDLTSLGQAVIMEEPTIIRMGDTMITEIQEVTKETENVVIAITGEAETISIEDNYELPLGLMIMEPIDTVAIQEPVELTNIVEVEPQYLVAGGVSYTQILSEEIFPIDPVEEEVLTVEETEELFPTDEIVTVKPETPIVIEEEIIPVEEEVLPVEEEETDRTGLINETFIVPVSQLEVKVSPNPSAGQITLSYNLDNNSPVKIELFDVTGKRVKTLSEQGRQYAGKYNVSYNISDLPNGIYMATLSTDENKISAKVILTK